MADSITGRPLLTEDARFRVVWLIVGGFWAIVIAQSLIGLAMWASASAIHRPFDIVELCGKIVGWTGMAVWPFAILIVWLGDRAVQTRKKVRDVALYMCGVVLAGSLEIVLLAGATPSDVVLRQCVGLLAGIVGVGVIFWHARRLPA